MKSRAKTQTGHLYQVAHKVVKNYTLEIVNIRLLTQRFNATLRVETADNQQFALRIHKPGIRRLIEIQSELSWLRALSEETNLVIPEIINAEEGNRIVTLEKEEEHPIYHCVLFRWIRGRHIWRKPPIDLAHKLGRVMGCLHAHADTFDPPTPFSQKRQGQVWSLGKPAALFPDEGNSYVSLARQTLSRRGSEKIQSYLDTLYETPKKLRFLHGDLHWQNVKLYQGALNIFDFDDAIWCHPAQDIAVPFRSMQRWDSYLDLWEAFQQGYEEERVWPVESDEQLATLIMARQFDILNWVIHYQDIPRFYRLLPDILN
ncbi:MAG: phosphotransferase [Chloroflexota bacterium]